VESRVDGKVALVTGASRGIGEAIAQAFLASGARGVVITSRKQENLDEAAERLDGGDRLAAVAARSDTEEGASTAVQTAIDSFGSCDILVNNAGTNPAIGNLVDVDLGAIDKTWAVNQRGPLLYARAAWHGSMKDNGGVICNTASVGGMRPGPMLGAYNISKAALIFLTKQLAFELAPSVRVVGVAPAVVKTRLSEMLWAGDDGVSAASTHPLNRLGEVEDVANAVAFLCSDAAGWITGTTLEVDGGVVNASAVLG
jgi:NAD(P)-dependent dehydrogenase (short-subunit alcohol dehydrogenase family)